MSLLLVVLIAISVSAVSADNATDAVAVSEEDSVDVVNDIEVVGNNIVPTTADASGVQTAVDNAATGDTIKLESKTYDFVNNTVTISGKDKITIEGTGDTIIQGHGAGNGLFYVSESAAVTLKGINFVDTNPKNDIRYDGNVAGWGVNFDGEGAANGTVDACTFKDFNQAVVVNSCNYVTVKNSNFTGGIATKLINDPTVNKEQGSKIINVGGSFFLTIENNIFDGPVLDALSIAKGSGDAKIIGNTFKNNVYSMFFGGASTEGTFINDNTFIACGVFDNNGTIWDEFPVISIQKASDSVYFNNNTFYAVNNNILIAAESANTAHGAPSSLGDINVTNNKVIKFDDDVVPRSVTLLHILSRSGDINPKAPITVTGNTFAAGVRPVVVWYNDWGKEDSSNIIIPQAYEPVATSVEANNLTVYAGDKGDIQVTLKDADGNFMANKDVSVVIDGEFKTITTDSNGTAVLNGTYAAGTHYATVAYLGDATYKGSVSSAKIVVKKKSTKLTAPKKTYKVKATKKLAVTLKSGSNLLKSKKVTLKINGKTYTKTTSKKGVATFTIKLAKKGSYSFTANFAGDNIYKAVTAKNKVIIK